MHSVNGLPLSYSGKLSLLINDRDPNLTFRNFFLLQILTQVTDEREAAELATHVWFSAFMPHAYWLQVMQLAMSAIEGGKEDRGLTSLYTQTFGNGSTAHYELSNDAKMCMLGALTSMNRYGIAEATNEYNRVM